MNKTVSFKESRIIGTSLLLFGMGFLMSVVPDISTPLILFNFVLAAIATVLFYVFWKKYRHQSKRYFSLLSYVMIIETGIFASIPLLRVYDSGFVFWFGIVMLITMVLLPYLFAKEIAFGIQKPAKSKLGKIYLIFALLIIGFGSSVYTVSLSTSDPDANVIAIFAFLCALLLFFIAPVFLIKQENMDEIVNE
ncbi:hypothetical protein [Saliterribacillus persicus]|uniref:Uncharacterized protein n=1 Tax=Saliterribacillus persicus TaxID=930114 RepID=A0A368XDW2_9BACI|nr:hypothetical protein [Saliterribacillus persicus]RCW65839.1 hypothetical protein DFR57_11056 [Saliterribacillus persicus]